MQKQMSYDKEYVEQALKLAEKLGVKEVAKELGSQRARYLLEVFMKKVISLIIVFLACIVAACAVCLAGCSSVSESDSYVHLLDLSKYEVGDELPCALIANLIMLSMRTV